VPSHFNWTLTTSRRGGTCGRGEISLPCASERAVHVTRHWPCRSEVFHYYVSSLHDIDDAGYIYKTYGHCSFRDACLSQILQINGFCSTQVLSDTHWPPAPYETQHVIGRTPHLPALMGSAVVPSQLPALAEHDKLYAVYFRSQIWSQFLFLSLLQFWCHTRSLSTGLVRPSLITPFCLLVLVPSNTSRFCSGVTTCFGMKMLSSYYHYKHFNIIFTFFHSCAVHLDTIKFFYLPTDAQ